MECEADITIEGSLMKNVSPQIMKVSSRSKEFQSNLVLKMEDHQETPKFKVN